MVLSPEAAAKAYWAARAYSAWQRGDAQGQVATYQRSTPMEAVGEEGPCGECLIVIAHRRLAERFWSKRQTGQVDGVERAGPETKSWSTGAVQVPGYKRPVVGVYERPYRAVGVR